MVRQHPGARKQNERRGDLGDGKHPQPAVGAGCNAHAATRQPHPVRGVRRWQTRHERQKHRRGDGQDDAHPQHARVNRDVQGPHREAGGIASEHRHHRSSDEDRENGAQTAEQQALRQQSAPQRPCTGAEGRANGELSLASNRPREDQVGDVRARDDEDQRGGRQQDEQHRSRRRDDLIAQANGIDAKVGLRGVRLRMLLENGAMDGLELGSRSLDFDARRESTEQLRHPMHTPVDHRRIQVMRARDDVGDDLGLGGVGNRRLEDADDRRGAIAQPNGPADHGWIALKLGGPEPVGENRRSSRLRPVVSRIDQAAQDRAEAHHLEVRTANDSGPDDARFAQPNHREFDGGEVPEGRQGLDPRLQVAQLGDRKVRVLCADTWRTLADIDQAVLVAVDQRTQQDPLHHAEDGSVGTDAKRQRQDHRNGETFDAGERTEGESEVGQQVHKVLFS